MEKAFLFNKTVEIIELQDGMPVEYRLDDARSAKRRLQFTARCQGELLQIKPSLTPREKAAFLSAIVRDNPSDEVAKECKALDSEMIGRIFKFAGREIRRQIVWKNPPLGTIRFSGSW